MPSKKGKRHPVGVGMTPSQSELGKYIRSRRIELDIGQVPLAKKCGFAQNFVSQLEIGIRKYLKNHQLEKLANALQCNPEELRKRMQVKPEVTPRTELRKLIRSRREKLGLSLEAFAARMKISPRKAKLLEISNSPTLRYSSIEPLATALEFSPSVFTPFLVKTRKESKSELGNLVRARRKALGMSIELIAERLGVSRQFVNQIEFGQTPLSQNDEMIAKLAQVLELDVAKLEEVRPRRRLKQVQTRTKATNLLGTFLAAKRQELHLTQREVGELADVSTFTISGMETGKRHPGPGVLERVAKALECHIPDELIQSEHSKNGHKTPRFRIKRESPLGKFVTDRRLELKLSQAEVAHKANTASAIISGVERGTYRPRRSLLERMAKALECEIPAELVPEPRQHGSRVIVTAMDTPSSVMFHLSDQNPADLERIKELSDIRDNSEAVRKVLKILRHLLEKQDDGYTVCLRKDENVVELELLF